MHYNKETGEEILNSYEQKVIDPHFTLMPQDLRDQIVVCIKIAGIRQAVKTYGFSDVIAVFLFHPSLHDMRHMR